MEPLHIQPPNLQSSSHTHYYMKSLSSKFKPTILSLTSSKYISTFATFSLTPNDQIHNLTHNSTQNPSREKPISRSSVRLRAKVSDAAQLKENWLDSLSCPFPEKNQPSLSGGRFTQSNVRSGLVIGIDPDLSGALAVLKTDKSGCSAQVFDSPYLPVLVSKRVRRRLDAKSIVQLLRSLDAPIGTTAYIEQSIPYPQDGKQGWWSGGFGYGLWIGILVASGFSVVPVPSMMWKNEFELCGGSSTKDDSRRVASTLFPSLSSLLKRKKDHGRAEALLIAAYGQGRKKKLDPSHVSEELIP